MTQAIIKLGPILGLEGDYRYTISFVSQSDFDPTDVTLELNGPAGGAGIVGDSSTRVDDRGTRGVELRMLDESVVIQRCIVVYGKVVVVAGAPDPVVGQHTPATDKVADAGATSDARRGTSPVHGDKLKASKAGHSGELDECG